MKKTTMAVLPRMCSSYLIVLIVAALMFLYTRQGHLLSTTTEQTLPNNDQSRLSPTDDIEIPSQHNPDNTPEKTAPQTISKEVYHPDIPSNTDEESNNVEKDSKDTDVSQPDKESNTKAESNNDDQTIKDDDSAHATDQDIQKSTLIFYNPYGQNKTNNPSFDPPAMAPCGQVCSYTGTIVRNETGSYPQLKKDINCPNMMARMAFQDNLMPFPPPEMPPGHLKPQYEMYGDMSISQYSYYNQGTNITAVKLNATRTPPKYFTRKDLEGLISKVRDGIGVNKYKDDGCVQQVVKDEFPEIRGQNGVVIGTLMPWLEAILFTYGAKTVTTLEYAELVSEYPGLFTTTPFTFAEEYLKGEAKQFDFGASFSSVEHSGLGRYSDPLNPYGDLEAMAQAWCMIKPGGLFLLGVPGSHVNNIVWNAHRLYSDIRLQYLTANWKVNKRFKCTGHHVLLLQKDEA